MTTWTAKCADGKGYGATIMFHEGTKLRPEYRPYYWSISNDRSCIIYFDTRTCGYAKTLAAAKSMCAREIRWNAGKDTKLVWKQEE